jgi:hypothetical protein
VRRKRIGTGGDVVSGGGKMEGGKPRRAGGL